MSERIPRSIFALSIAAGVCWIARLLRGHIWHVVELFGGLERLVVGLFLVVAIEHAGEVLVALLVFGLFWTVLRDGRSFHQLERRMRIAVVAGLLFLVLSPFTSSLFYFVVPQPDTRAVTVALYVGRNVSVALLIGSLALPRAGSTLSAPP